MACQEITHHCPTPSESLLSAIRVLNLACCYAEQTSGEQWEFAVEIQRLHEIGLDHNDLRWLVRMGYVEHGHEVTLPGDDSRHFRSSGDLTFTKRTCFILTNPGGAFAKTVGKHSALSGQQVENNGNGNHNPAKPVPLWDAETRELTVSGQMVKRFKWQAVNQEIVLSTFQEDSWPVVIDDPLPPKLEQDSKRRLHDTIKALNRNQEHPLLRFHGNGTGEGIRWEFLTV